MITVTPTNERTETGARVYEMNANGKTAKIVSVSLAGHSVEINYYVNGEIRGKAHGADNPQMIELMEAWNARWSKKTETVTTEEVAAPVEAEAICTGTGSEWTFKDCKVSEDEFDGDLHCFVVTMERDGEVRTQTIIPQDLDDMENVRKDLNDGRSPVWEGWEDGMGNEVCWENAKGEAPAYSFVRMAGHDGSEEGFDTLQEAIDAADDTWYHLTKRDRAEYSKPGCYFMVIEGGISEDGDFGNIVRDFTEEEEEEERIDEWTGTKRISSQGNSLSVSITDACRILGLRKGDVVEVTIRRKE